MSASELPSRYCNERLHAGVGAVRDLGAVGAPGDIALEVEGHALDVEPGALERGAYRESVRGTRDRSRRDELSFQRCRKRLDALRPAEPRRGSRRSSSSRSATRSAA